MNDFYSFLEKRNLIEILKKEYNINRQPKSQNILLAKIINYISQNARFFESNLDDIIGNAYQNILNHWGKKKLGEFYTPLWIVDYILTHTGLKDLNFEKNKAVKIIDLSCGSGSFIREIIKITFKWYLKENSQTLPLSEHHFKDFLNFIKNSIYGIDINPVACYLCYLNILHELYIILKASNSENGDYDFLNFKVIVNDALGFEDTNFDYVIGNPPYLFIRDIPEGQKNAITNSSFTTNRGQYDLYQIFLELGIRILKNHGSLGFIIPDSILTLSHRGAIRKYIFNNTKIKEICAVGSAFKEPVVSNTILILEKENNAICRYDNAVLLFKDLQNDRSQIEIKQGDLSKFNYNFLIDLNQVDFNILTRLKTDYPNLKALSTNPSFKFHLTRGVEIGRRGHVILCRNCGKYMPKPERKAKCIHCGSKIGLISHESIIHDTISEYSKQSYAPYLSSMNRYKVKLSKYILLDKPGINYKDIDLYKDRIIIRQLTENGLICATYHSYSVTNQSYYNLKLIKSPTNEFNAYYLLGLINSHLISYFFLKLFGSYKKLFPRVLIEKVKTFPIKIPENDDEKSIASSVSTIVSNLVNNSSLSKKERFAMQEYLNALIFTLYKIDKKEQQHILNYIKQFSI